MKVRHVAREDAGCECEAFPFCSHSLTMNHCIKDGCGLAFDPAQAEIRNRGTLKLFWERYCPKHREIGA